MLSNYSGVRREKSGVCPCQIVEIDSWCSSAI